MSQPQTEDLPFDACPECGTISLNISVHDCATDPAEHRPQIEPRDFGRLKLPYTGTASVVGHVPGIGGEPLCNRRRFGKAWRYAPGDGGRFDRICGHCLDVMARRRVVVGHVLSWGEIA